MTAPMDMEGPAAPPRANGELVFAEPWESRAFGMAVALYEAGLFTWPQFQAALIARIAGWEAARTGGAGWSAEATEGAHWSYYEHWLAALEDVLADSGAMLADEITARARALAQRRTGHDR
ncbi:MAG TPA: nitrile hydratase accessory protein [Mycobacterium sp.]|nr:nitrile hydratase accessory protein [Mycobacterium sp.]